jgi:NDP-sugar pyrophosphorylase family protein
MFAVIYQVPARPGVGMLSIAGRPLIERQLQWLRAVGCQRVALEIGTDPESSELACWLSEREALGADVTIVLASHPLGAAEVAQRAGFPVGVPFLAVPGDVLGDGDLTQLYRVANASGAWAMTNPPEGTPHPLEAGVVRLLGPRREHPKIVDGAGWTARVKTVRDAMALGSAALMKRLPEQGGAHAWGIQIHASEIEPGIWVARGATVDPGAKLTAPVLIGAEAIIRAGAQVGPDAFIGDRAVIEAEAVVADATVEPGTIVGEGVALRGCVASPWSVTELSGGEGAALEDSLIIGHRDRRPKAPLSSRAAALAMLFVLLLPASLLYLGRALFGLSSWRSERLFSKHGPVRLRNGTTGIGIVDLVPRLYDVLRGYRSLLGVATTVSAVEGVSPGLLVGAMSAPFGAIDIEPALVPEGGDLEMRLRGRAWYAHAKSPGIDLTLVKSLFWIKMGRAIHLSGSSSPTPAAPTSRA